MSNPAPMLPGLSAANATRALIIACVIVTVAAFLSPWLDRALTIGGGLIPARLLGHMPELRALPAPATLVSSLFIHGSLAHLAFNMVFLAFVGRTTEALLGPQRFLLLYFVAGIIGGLTQVMIEPQSVVPIVGASGAISGVFAAHALLFGRAGDKGAMIRALQLAALWIGLQLATGYVFNLNGEGSAGGIAIGAHVGGFAVGLALAIPLARSALPPPR